MQSAERGPPERRLKEVYLKSDNLHIPALQPTFAVTLISASVAPDIFLLDKKLFSTEMNYFQIAREALALLLGITKSKYFIDIGSTPAAWSYLLV